MLDAHKRIARYISPTPIFSSTLLNDWLGHQVFFKMECFQKTGAFKLRGASNILSKRAEQDNLPTKVIANSSGNHAQGVAYAASLFKLPAKIYCGKNISSVKAAATQFYGAQVEKFDTRKEADEQIANDATHPGTLWIPPYNHPDIIAGQGTATLESLKVIPNLDAIFAPCGGGGLLSGTVISARAMSANTQVIGVEPKAGNDAAQSLRAGNIISLPDSPTTLADGAATLSVSELTYHFLQQLDDFYEASEHAIAYWTQWLQHLLKTHIEPTSAMTMDGVVRWLKGKSRRHSVLVIVSGGNIDQAKMAQVWAQDYLSTIPSLDSV